jgi:RNA polymerase sigma-70 factor, ECF subfamily
MDEQEAIARMKRGDPGGLEAIVIRYQVKAVHSAFLVTQDTALAEDVAQDTFLQVFHKIGQFDNQRPFEPWLMRCVVHAAIKAARKQQRSVPLEPEEEKNSLEFLTRLVDTHLQPEDEAEQSETRRQVLQAIKRLSPDHRAAIVLRYYLELSEAEMIAELQRPASTVKWWLYSAKRTLRDWLRQNDFKAGSPATHELDKQERKE